MNGSDLRPALRSFRRAPIFSTASVAVLAVGIAVNTAAFCVVRTLVKRPLPFAHAERLALVGERNGRAGVSAGASRESFRLWRERGGWFEEIGAVEPRPMAVGGAGEPESVSGAEATAGFFRTLSLGAALGRVFTEDDERPGAARVAVLGYNYWRARYGADRSVVGRTITVEEEPATVVGVLPRIGRSYYASYGVWMPMRAGGGRSLQVAARLRPEASLARAEAELAALSTGEAGKDNEDWRPFVVSMAAGMKHTVPMYAILLAAVLLLLALVCANLAAMQLARAAARQKEIALRIALGAGRMRIVRQLLTEGLLVSGMGGALGFALTAAARSILMASVPDLADLQLDWAVAGWAALVAALAGILMGLSPALTYSRPDLHTALKTVGRMADPAAGKRARGVLVTAEMAVAVGLLASVGLIARGFVNLRRADVGFRTDGLVTVSVGIPQKRWPTAERRVAFAREAVEKARLVAGVESVAAAGAVPLMSRAAASTVEVEGSGEARAVHAQHNPVTPEYFRTAGIPLRSGRAFEAGDTAGSSPVIVVNARAADLLWPGKTAVGKRVRLDGGPWRQVVGVAGDARQDLLRPAVPEFYTPLAQDPRADFVLLARTGRPEAAGALRATLRDMDHESRIGAALTMGQIMEGYFPSAIAAGCAAFCGAALLIAGLGLYGVAAYLAGQRSHEFGVRLALGATPGDIRRLVLAQGLRLAGAGAAIGLALALVAGRLVAGALPGVPSWDPLVLVSVCALLAGIALAATAAPARRAARLDPIAALRAE